jgi:hypothetical protein
MPFQVLEVDYKVDPDALLAAFLRGIGLSPRRYMRSKRALAIFRKRSAAAKLGWRRRRRQAGNLVDLITMIETEPVPFVKWIRKIRRKRK